MNGSADLFDGIYEGELAEKLDRLAATGGIDVLPPEHDEHLPGTGLAGWVIGIFEESRVG